MNWIHESILCTISNWWIYIGYCGYIEKFEDLSKRLRCFWMKDAQIFLTREMKILYYTSASCLLSFARGNFYIYKTFLFCTSERLLHFHTFNVISLQLNFLTISFGFDQVFQIGGYRLATDVVTLRNSNTSINDWNIFGWIDAQIILTQGMKILYYTSASCLLSFARGNFYIYKTFFFCTSERLLHFHTLNVISLQLNFLTFLLVLIRFFHFR